MQTSDKINLVIAVATCLSVVASLAVAFLTLHIAKSNRLTAKLMEIQIEAASRPYIRIGPTIRIGTPLIQLSIANIGQSNAVNLRLELDRDFYFNADAREGNNLRRYRAFADPISTFSPQSMLIFDLGTGPSIFSNAEKCPLRFTVKATYKHNDVEFSEETTIDLQPFHHSTVPHDVVADEIGRLVQAVEKIGERVASAG